MSNRSSSVFRYLPAGDEGDRTMAHSSSDLGMRGIPVVPLVFCAITSVHVGRWKFRADCWCYSLRFGCDCGWIDEEVLESRDFRPIERTLE